MTASYFCSPFWLEWNMIIWSIFRHFVSIIFVAFMLMFLNYSIDFVHYFVNLCSICCLFFFDYFANFVEYFIDSVVYFGSFCSFFNIFLLILLVFVQIVDFFFFCFLCPLFTSFCWLFGCFCKNTLSIYIFFNVTFFCSLTFILCHLTVFWVQVTNTTNICH